MIFRVAISGPSLTWTAYLSAIISKTVGWQRGNTAGNEKGEQTMK
jgi:hypothetical protein